MNLTQDLEEFHSELEKVLSYLQSIKDKYPQLFDSVLPEGEEIRLGDALQVLYSAEIKALEILQEEG